MSPKFPRILFKTKKETLVGLTLIMLATTFLNIVPEFFQGLSSMADEQVTAQAPSTPPNTRFVFIDEDGDELSEPCTIHPDNTTVLPTTIDLCTLQEAVNTVSL